MNLPLYSSCVMDHRYWLGSFRDWSGNENHGTPSACYWQKRPDTNIRFPATGVITVNDSPSLQIDGAVTLVAYGEFDTYSNADRVISKRDAGGSNYGWFLSNSTSFGFYDGIGTKSMSAANWGGSKFMALTCVDGGTALAYVDGLYKDDANGTSTIAPNDAPLLIGNYFAADRPLLANPLKGVLIYNTALSDAQIAQAYEWTQEQTSPSYKKKNFYVPSQLTGREDSLVAAWDMENIAQKVIDKTGNGNDGTIFGSSSETTSVGKALRTTTGNGIQVISSASIDDVVASTLSFMLNADSAGDSNAGRIYDKVRRYAYINTAGNIVLYEDFDGATNGQWLTTTAPIIWGQWHHVVIVYDYSSVDNVPVVYVDGVSQALNELNPPVGSRVSDSGDDLYLSNKTGLSRAVDGKLADFRVYNKELSQAEVSAIYKKYATLPYFVDDLSDANESVAAETDFLSTTDWKVTSGSYSIAQDETNRPGKKHIECVTDGNLYTQSTHAFGTWEFDYYHSSDTSTRRFIFMENTDKNGSEDGYAFTFWSATPQIAIQKFVGGSGSTLLSTAANYVELETWYSIRITRRYDGQFTLYIKGGSYAEFTLVDVTGGSGSNPIIDTATTASKYMVCFFDYTSPRGDAIANFKFYQGVV